jgi:Holliday junction resolvase RusA-like endonuclease
MLIFDFDIDPIGKGRPRFGRGYTYTPEKTRMYEESLAILAREQFNQDPFTRPVAVTMTFYMPTKDKKRWVKPCTMKPDLTNLTKAVEDALNGIVWLDDSLIAKLSLYKTWARDGSIRVTVEEL